MPINSATDETVISEGSPAPVASHAISIDRTHGGTAPAGVIDFSASVNPLGPPPAAIEEYHRAAESMVRYPSPYPDPLAARIAKWAGSTPAQVLVGNGSTQIIHLLARAMGWRRPAIVTPTFSEIANALILAGAEPEAIELDRERGFALRLDRIGHALDKGADAILLGRPNSPTGSLIPFATMRAIVKLCARRGADCVVDEAFIDFTDSERSMVELAGARARLLVLRSLTKIFAIPGLRIGFLVAAAPMVARLRELMEPWSVNVIAEQVSAACLAAGPEYLRRTIELVAHERAFVIAGLSANPRLRVFPSAANFLMVEARGEASVGEFGRCMLERAVAVRDLSSLPGCGGGFYRIGIRARADNLRLLEAACRYGKA